MHEREHGGITIAFLCPHLLHSRYVSMPSQFQCLCKPYIHDCILFSFVFSILFVLKVPSRTADIKPDRDELVAQEGGVVHVHAHVQCHVYNCISVQVMFVGNAVWQPQSVGSRGELHVHACVHVHVCVEECVHVHIMLCIVTCVSVLCTQLKESLMKLLVRRHSWRR